MGNQDPVKNKTHRKLCDLARKPMPEQGETFQVLWVPFKTLTINTFFWLSTANGTQSAEMWSRLAKVSKTSMLQALRPRKKILPVFLQYVFQVFEALQGKFVLS